MIRDKATYRKRGSKMIFRKPTLGKYPLACLLYDESVHQDGCDGGQYKRYYDALNNGTLEIQGYIREELFHETVKKVGEWTKFDPSDESTYPPNKTHVLVYGLSDNMRDDEKLCGLDVDFWLNDHFVCYRNITHWRPLPEPPVESNCE